MPAKRRKCAKKGCKGEVLVRGARLCDKHFAETKAVCPERVLTLPFRATGTHCATWVGDVTKCCPHLMTSRFGSRWHCGVFHGKDLWDGRDTLRRLPECIEAERRAK